jgi:hypothetical protein
MFSHGLEPRVTFCAIGAKDPIAVRREAFSQPLVVREEATMQAAEAQLKWPPDLGGGSVDIAPSSDENAVS